MISGAILAGGQNRRMGGKMKALLRLDGQLFIERQLAELSQLCSEIIIVANEPELFEAQLAWPHAQMRIVPDKQLGKGPLAGLQAAMAAVTHSEELWVVACDMPYASAEAAQVLLGQLRSGARHGGHDLALPLIAGRLQPLHAIYHRRCLQAIDQQLAEGRYRIMELVEQMDAIAVEERFFLERQIALDFVGNVNEPSDLAGLKNNSQC
ncbi:molybdenum cofactor guanylyltransferase [Paenibacillus agricola]|uniref:Probable molybdenum cofactor guanylyltransferase n=1 Tax=Paenibacillus agricola TaxID=2716264 RepID=A0ABX0JKK5_9BACL|nr:molybdenum cofactor guanylyltransferase [Paenibacillus agricola]NHN34586.1 molybdenum cofactor guanylyltransferase [Paenibacillus agricola]